MLDVQNVSKDFYNADSRQTIAALRNVSLSFSEGEFVCLLGKSGCGKSTLLGLIAGLIAPDSGQVLFRGKTVREPDRHRMMMFQEAALFPWLDVQGNVLYGLELIAGLGKAERLRTVDEFLDMVGLSEFRHFRVHELSGGMRQRVALARALAPDPDVLLMDEPFSALDAMTRERLYSDLQNIWRKTGKTIVMVTHNVREAVCLGGRVVILDSHCRVAADEPVPLPYPRVMNDAALAVAAGRFSSFLSGCRDAAEEGEK